MGRPAEWERGAQGTEGETQNDGSWSDFSQQSNNSKSASMCGVVVIFIGMSCDILWNRVMLRVASSQQRGLIYEHSKDSLWTQQWGPESPRITRPWHVSSFALLCFARVPVELPWAVQVFVVVILTGHILSSACHPHYVVIQDIHVLTFIDQWFRVF